MQPPIEDHVVRGMMAIMGTIDGSSISDRRWGPPGGSKTNYFLTKEELNGNFCEIFKYKLCFLKAI